MSLVEINNAIQKLSLEDQLGLLKSTIVSLPLEKRIRLEQLIDDMKIEEKIKSNIVPNYDFSEFNEVWDDERIKAFEMKSKTFREEMKNRI